MLAVGVALAVFVVGVLVTWLVGTPFSDDACLDSLASLTEGSSSTSKPALWPPGTISCEYVTPAGAVSQSTVVPWFDWLFFAFLAAGAGGTAWAVATILRRR